MTCPTECPRYPDIPGGVIVTSKKKKDGEDEVFLGTGAAGDPHDPAKRQSPNDPTPVIIPDVPVADDTPKKDDDK